MQSLIFLRSLLGLLTILDERLPTSLRCYMETHRIQCKILVFSQFYNTCIFCSLLCQYYRTLYTPQPCNKHKNHSRANKELPKDQRSKPTPFCSNKFNRLICLMEAQLPIVAQYTRSIISNSSLLSLYLIG